MDLAALLTAIFAFVLIKMFLEQRDKARQERVRLLEAALNNPNLDRNTIETLAFQLTGAKPARAAGVSRLGALMLAVGWLSLFVGVALWAISTIIHDEDMLTGGVITGVVGFGLVTYPFALRELEARRAA